MPLFLRHGLGKYFNPTADISRFLKGHLMKKERSTRLRWSRLRKIIYIAFGLAVFAIAAKPVLAQETVLGPKDLKIGWFGIHFSFHRFKVDEPGEGTIAISKSTSSWRSV